MKFKRIADQAKRIVDQRGGTDALKRDAEELKGIAKGRGSVSDKAKAAAKAIKEPGAPRTSPERRETEEPSAARTSPERRETEEPIVDQQGPAVEASRPQGERRG